MIAGSPVEPQDIPVEIRHLESTRSMLNLSDKVPYLFAQGRKRLWDGMELVALGLGLEGFPILEESRKNLGERDSLGCLPLP